MYQNFPEFWRAASCGIIVWVSDKALQLHFGDCLESAFQVFSSNFAQKIYVKWSKPKSIPVSKQVYCLISVVNFKGNPVETL